MTAPKHSVECRFQNFLDYSKLRGQSEELLRRAFYAGADANPPVEPVSQACPVCDEQPKED
jgi:hypothetical protein